MRTLGRFSLPRPMRPIPVFLAGSAPAYFRGPKALRVSRVASQKPAAGNATPDSTIIRAHGWCTPGAVTCVSHKPPAPTLRGPAAANCAGGRPGCHPGRAREARREPCLPRLARNDNCRAGWGRCCAACRRGSPPGQTTRQGPSFEAWWRVAPSPAAQAAGAGAGRGACAA